MDTLVQSARFFRFIVVVFFCGKVPRNKNYCDLVVYKEIKLKLTDLCCSHVLCHALFILCTRVVLWSRYLSWSTLLSHGHGLFFLDMLPCGHALFISLTCLWSCGRSLFISCICVIYLVVTCYYLVAMWFLSHGHVLTCGYVLFIMLTCGNILWPFIIYHVATLYLTHG